MLKLKTQKARSQAVKRRDFLKYAGAGALVGSVGLVSANDFELEVEQLVHVMWTHGTSLHVRHPDRGKLTRIGFGSRFEGNAFSTNWFHFAIPTPVYVSDTVLSIRSVMLSFKTMPGTSVQAVQVWDGSSKKASLEDLNFSLNHFFELLDVPGHPQIHRGVGISVKGAFGEDIPRIDFFSAGAEFIFKRGFNVVSPVEQSLKEHEESLKDIEE